MNTVQQTVDTYADMLFRIAWQRLGQREEAEDVVQEALLRFIQQPPFDNEAYAKAWLIRVTINLCRDHQKSAWHRLTEPLTQDLPGLPDESRGVLEELKRLSPDHRDVLYLYYFEGYQIAEIADILHVNKRTIGTRLARAKKRLKTILEEDAR